MARLRRRVMFLSYCSDERERTDAIVQIIEQLGGTCHLDRDHFALSAGKNWEAVRDKSIKDADDGLLLMVTPSIFGPSDAAGKPQLRPQIQAEIDVAKCEGKHRRALILDVGAFDKLTKHFPDVWSDPKEQFVNLEAEFSKWPQINQEKIEKRLWGLVTDDLAGYISAKSEECRDWAQSLIPKEREVLISDPEPEAWQLASVRSGFFAVVAPGGEGKSVLVARWIINADRWIPLSLSLPTLVAGPRAIAQDLGAINEDGLASHLDSLRRLLGKSIVVVVDALEHVLTGRSRESVTGTLRRLAEKIPILCTVRPAIWSANLTWILPESHTVRLEGKATRAFLERHPDVPAGADRLLTDALFIDHYLLTAPRTIEMTTQWDFLIELLGLGKTEGIPSTRVRAPSHQEVLTALAHLQLNARSYDIELPQLIDDLIAHGFDAQATMKAVDSSLLLRQDKQNNTVRLRHDMLDAGNCVRVLCLHPPELRKWLDRRFEPIDIQVAVALVRLQADAFFVSGKDEDGAMFRSSLDRVLRLLDIKNLEPDGATRAWHGTWILEELLLADRTQLIVGLIIDTIGGAIAESLNKPLPSSTDLNVEYSTCEEPPRRTRECMSSMVSLWRVFKAEMAPLPERAVPMLISELGRSRYRIRVIEALEKYGGTPVREAFLQAAANEVRADRALLGPLARALRPWAHEQPTKECLKNIVKSDNADVLARREARLALDHSPASGGYSEEELVWGLTPFDRYQSKTISDWSQVVLLTDYIIGEAKRTDRAWSAATIDGLDGCMSHRMPPAQIRAAMALGAIKSPGAAIALLMKLLQRARQSDGDPQKPEVLDTQFLASIREALNDICSADSALRNGIIRALRMCRSELVGEGETSRVEVVDAVLGGNALGDAGSLATEGASVLLPPCARITFGRIAEGDEYPLSAQAAQVAGFTSDDEVGPSLEPKYRIAIDRDVPFLIRTDWKVGRGFHLGLGSHRREHAVLELRICTCLTPLAHVQSQPGLACVHSVLLLQDDVVLATKRAETSVHPGRWSVSWEEQINPSDVAHPDHVRATLARALREELGVAVDTTRMFESVILEHDSLNVNIVVGARLDLGFSDVEAAFEKREKKDEIAEIRAIPLSQGVDQLGPTALHPSSELRLNLLRIFLSRGADNAY